MRKKYVCVHGCKSYVVGLGIKVMWYAWVLTGWNAWTVVPQNGMRHNPKTEYSDRYPLPSRGLMAA